MPSDAVLEVIEKINDIKAILYLNDYLSPTIKEICLEKIKALESKRKVLEAYKK